MNVIKDVFLQILYVLNLNIDIFEFSINFMSIIIFIIIGSFLIMFIKFFID